MSDEALYSRGRHFFNTIRMLREMPSDELRFMCLFASLYWDDEKLKEGEVAGDLPGNDGALSNSHLNS
jgi:hypothetical protein